MLRNSEKEVEQNSRFSPGYRMIDSGRRSDLFRRYGVSAPLRCAPASPSSRLLVSTKNLCRGQGVPDRNHQFSVTTFFAEEYCSCFGRVTMNNPGSRRKEES